MIDIKQAHSYVRALFHAILAESENTDSVRSTLMNQYPTYTFLPLEDEVDRAYILKSADECIISISGTKNLQGWIRNGQCLIDSGWHYGFRKSFRTLLMNPIIEAMHRFRGKVLIYGHSAGSPIGLNAAHFIRSSFQRNCEAITFCGPQAVSKMGRDACRNAHVCMTTINIDHHDVVDNVTKLIGGVNYGKIVYLPDVGDPKISDSIVIDKLFMGHAPSYVCKALKELMRIWNKAQDVYIDYVKTFAKV